MNAELARMQDEIKDAFIQASRAVLTPSDTECCVASVRGKLVADLRRLFETRKHLTRMALDREISLLVDVALAKLDKVERDSFV